MGRWWASRGGGGLDGVDGIGGGDGGGHGAGVAWGCLSKA